MSVALGRGAAALAFSRALLFPTMALPRSPWRRWRCALLVPTAALGTPIGGVVLCFAFPQRRLRGLPPPRPIGSCPARPQSCPCLPHRARVAVLRCVRLAVGVCFALSTDSPRGRGRRGRRSRPKPSAALSRPSELAEKVPRSVYRLAAGVAPYPLVCPALRCEAGRKPREGGDRFCEVGTTPRTANRETGVVCASRWLRLFPRQRDAARTLREHFAQGERIVRPLSGIPDNGRYQEITVIRKVGFASSGCGTGELRFMPVNIG